MSLISSRTRLTTHDPRSRLTTHDSRLKENNSMKLLTSAWEQVYGLLVEDGQIAIGTLLAFAAAAGLSALGREELRDPAGPLLFVLLMSLLLVNLYTTGRKAFAKRVSR